MSSADNLEGNYPDAGNSEMCESGDGSHRAGLTSESAKTSQEEDIHDGSHGYTNYGDSFPPITTPKTLPGGNLSHPKRLLDAFKEAFGKYTRPFG